MSRRQEEKPRAYKGTKFFNYPDPLPLEEILTILSNKGRLERKERDGDTRSIITVKSPLSNLNLIQEFGLMGTISYKIQKPTGEGSHYWKIIPFDFLICRDPSVLLLHGSRSLMHHIVDELEKVIYPRNEDDEDDDNPDRFFIPYNFDRADGKYIIKKIVKKMELQNARNILYEPHFENLRENRDIRGGETFHRRDGSSATNDEKFCYLFELCTYWQPEVIIYSCGGITCPMITEPIKVTINSDFSFSFSHKIPKTSLDTFCTSVILPIIRENDYNEERTECVENARGYLERSTPSQ